MEVVFRQMPPEPGEPPVGEIHIRSVRPGKAAGRDLALQVLDRGVEALLAGPGPTERIVIPAGPLEPTLDDCLAATFVALLLEGQEIPAGARAFAQYTALVRQGLSSPDLPVEDSLEGIYLALLNAGDGDLSNPEEAERFRSDWARMAEVILAAAREGKDPSATALFEGNADFGRERAFLARDREVYRQDVLRGERWLVELPGGGPPLASAIVLREPRSLVFKYWSRRDREAPEGEMYLFMAVQWGPGVWVFSTDPVQRIGLKSLYEKLQAAELAKNPATDGWFDGAPFKHTLVAAPHDGSRLGDREILALVKAWAKARKAPSARMRLARPLAVVAAAAVMAAGAVLVFRQPDRPDRPDFGRRGPPLSMAKRPDFRHRGPPLSMAKRAEVRKKVAGFPKYALVIGVANPDKKGKLTRLPAACRDAAAVYRLLRDKYGYEPKNMRLLVDERDKAREADGKTPLPVYEEPSRTNLINALNELSRLSTQSISKGSAFVFYYSGHGERQKKAETIGYLALSGYDGTRDGAFWGYDMGHLSQDIQRRIGTTHQLLLVDSCFSGFTIVARGVPSGPDDKIYALWGKKAHVIITAGAADQEALERVGDEHSIFTEALLRALGEEQAPAADANDGIVTDSELHTFLEQAVPAMLPPGKRDHKPMRWPKRYRGVEGDDVGQFLFVPRSRPAP